MQKITPFLWFNTEAEEAANFYVSVFKNSKINHITRAPGGGPMPEGMALVISYELEGFPFNALNGGPGDGFRPNEAVSFSISCEDQAEVDYYWDKLSAVPEKEICGWLRDKYGYSWQIVPKILPELLNNSDKEKATRAMQAMMKMKKIIIADIEKAIA